MNKEILADVLKGSGVKSEELAELTPSQEGFTPGNGSNIWYLEDLSGTRLVIKEYPTWVGNNDISWIHEYMRQLAQKGFPLAKAIGGPTQKNGHYYGIYEYTFGSFNRENKTHALSMAQTLRKLYDSSKDIKIPGCRNWPTVCGYQPNPDRLASFDSDHGVGLLGNAWKIASTLLQGRYASAMPIHGDFRRDNIAFGQSGVTKVFDFGNSRNDYAEVDLAIALRDIADDPDIGMDNFLKIYRDSSVSKVRIIPEVISASSLILPIQECLYLWKESSQSPSGELKNALSREMKNLEYQLAVLSQRLSLYREIFSD